MSVMEMSHRSKPFAAIMEAAEQDIRDLMDIPDNCRVLFLQGRRVHAVRDDPP